MKRESIFDRFFALIFVPKCACCREILKDGERVLCRVCRAKYDMLCHRKCRFCGRDICQCDCTRDGIAAQGVWRLSKLCAYLPSEERSPVKALLFALKHSNRADVREFFATEMAQMIKSKHPEYKDGYTLCYVPRSTASYKKYGYDHARELSRLISDKLGIPYEDLFCRTKIARVQKQLGRAERFENTQNSIDLRGHCKKDGNAFCDRRFILIDDVCVTGASLGRCASLLISEGAVEVRCFVIGVRP